MSQRPKHHAMDNTPGNPTPISPAAEVRGRIDLDAEPIVIAFEVLGQAATQGSVCSMPMRKKGGGLVMKDGRPLLRPVHQNAKKLKPWRQDVARAARLAYSGPLLVGAVKVSMMFSRSRPKGHFGTGRNAGKLKPWAEEARPTTKPDVLKLARAVEDALTGVVWRDDSQVVEETLSKVWGTPGVAVRIESLDGQAEAEKTAKQNGLVPKRVRLIHDCKGLGKRGSEHDVVKVEKDQLGVAGPKGIVFWLREDDYEPVTSPGWKRLAIDKLDVTENVLTKMGQKDILTLGDFQQFQAKHGEFWAKELGLRGKQGEAVTAAFDRFWAEHPEFCGEAEADAGYGAIEHWEGLPG